MKFIDNLLLRKLLSTKVISCIARDPMLCDSSNALEEHIVECDSDPQGYEYRYQVLQAAWSAATTTSGLACRHTAGYRCQALQTAWSAEMRRVASTMGQSYNARPGVPTCDGSMGRRRHSHRGGVSGYYWCYRLSQIRPPPPPLQPCLLPTSHSSPSTCQKKFSYAWEPKTS